jgi:hypothetical protein
VVVKDSTGNPVANATVVFTAPAAGASGTFANQGIAATVVTNASGMAVSPAFTANATDGAYAVLATTTGAPTPAMFALSNTPAFSLSGLPATQQPGTAITSATLTLAQPSTVPYSGTVTLSFTPNLAALDSAVASELPTGFVGDAGFGTTTDSSTAKPTTAPLTIPAASTSVALPTLDPGTVAGTLTVSFTVPGQTTPTVSTITIPQEPPSITSTPTLTQTSGGFDVDLVVLSSTLDVTSATFTFAANSGYKISGDATITVPISSSVFQTWYAEPVSADYGGTFSLTVPFNITGDYAAIKSVTVTLHNAAGDSTPAVGTPE